MSSSSAVQDAPVEQSSRPVGEIVDRLRDAASGDEVSLRDLVESFGESSFLPALMVPALLVVSPLSGIPLFSTFCGLLIAFIAGQMLISRRYLWLPDFLMSRSFDGAKARKAMDKLRVLSDWLDKHAKRRLRVMTSGPMRKVLQLICVLCGLAMPFLELVPFSSSILGLTVLCFATAMLVRDGLFATVGCVTLAAAVLVPLMVAGVI
ncbi:exopolysaccharide biosynthesis protein [Salipiger sp. PrR002]|uniref:exopolysaccharide biosynthesis protein n=1 Tax=Salipiger sp. PrR002 TaxID=2706489 RepID=UPI0013BE4E88|nr:exopolysaccharide biosynthesis protein [Salipiger sp. PrR002]NDV99678.1 exopolysaccharide biosynthesis protein [Salipiger sp. PrR002]NDW56724.1 exopolysaccharide biosynthesis protein [Salipiger sp. PrR004]